MRWATVVLTTALLLGSASVVAAECAWVLWSGTGPSGVMFAYMTQKECEGSRRIQLLDAQKEMALQCLPDTMKPEAKCTWVLWKDSLDKGPQPERTGFKTHEECEAARDVMKRKIPDTSPFSFRCVQIEFDLKRPLIGWILWRSPLVVTATSPTDTFKTGEDCERRIMSFPQAQRWRFRCFPDTIDPRESK